MSLTPAVGRRAAWVETTQAPRYQITGHESLALRTLRYRPVYAVEYEWKAKGKRQVIEFDALTGEARAEGGVIKKHAKRILEMDALFDIGSDTAGMLVPGGGVAVKLGRLAARKALR